MNISGLWATGVKFSRGVSSQQMLDFWNNIKGSEKPATCLLKAFWAAFGPARYPAQLQALAESNKLSWCTFPAVILSFALGVASSSCLHMSVPRTLSCFHSEHWLFFSYYLADLAVACASIKCLSTMRHSQRENECTTMHFVKVI